MAQHSASTFERFDMSDLVKGFIMTAAACFVAIAIHDKTLGAKSE